SVPRLGAPGRCRWVTAGPDGDRDAGPRGPVTAGRLANPGVDPVEPDRPAGPRTTRRVAEMSQNLPLRGLTVLALEQAVAAPYCTSRLADAGARVIKIERPEGDFARGYDSAVNGLASYFVWLNRGKESLVA